MSLGVELNSLVFKFFWGGKRDLVARRVVVQPLSLGGFAVVDFFSKVSALHVQWVSRFLVSPSSWVSFMVFWFSSVLGSPPHAVFSAPGAFALGGLPRLYCSLVSSWVVCRGSLWASGFGIGSGIFSSPVESLSCKSAYWFLLSELVVSPHWVEKFFPLFGSLYWSATFASAVSVRLLLMSWIVSRLVSASISRCSSVAFPPIVATVFSSVSGVLVVILLQSSMAVSSFIFSLLFGIPVLCAGLVGRLVTLGSAIC